MEKKITRDMKVIDIVENFPEVIPILMEYGLHCVGCYFSAEDTLEAGARTHGLDGEEIEMMIEDANEIIEELDKN
jgi:hybrid cluster-associated redox disulfide protein